MRYYQVVVRGGFYGQLRGDTRRLKGERTVGTIDLVCTSWMRIGNDFTGHYYEQQ